MKKIDLNKQEKQELKKRGFFVKEYFSYKELLISTLLHIGILFLCFLGASIITETLHNLVTPLVGYNYILSSTYNWLIYGLSLSIGGFLWLRTNFFYIFLGKLFFLNKKVFANAKVYNNTSNISSLKYISWIKNFVNTQSHGVGSFVRWLLLLIPTIGIGLLGITRLISDFFAGMIIIAIPLGIYAGIAGGVYLLRQLVEHFHPLYAFGNLGEKIQKLTPKIEEKSKQIQSEFQSDMNYSVLSHGFDSLSATFSDIIGLVIKLEKVEARANKGNLFDSEKYINSLRSDIVTPLTSLKIFLEKQKSELLTSQKELTRVRIGGSEGTGNIELQSKRSESLITELTENIEKLEVMIGKMG